MVQNRNNPAVLYLHKLLQVLFPPTPSPVRGLNCDDTSHTTSACPVPSTPQPSGSGTRNQRQRETLRGKCFKCDQLGHSASKCPTSPRDMNKIICFGCGQTGRFGRDCPHTPSKRPVENLSISTRIWNSVSASLSLTSRPSERRSQATTSIDAQTQAPTVSTPHLWRAPLPTTSVLKWSNDGRNTLGQRPVPPARCRNKTGLWLHSFYTTYEEPLKCQIPGT
jgi:hypothetical protein